METLTKNRTDLPPSPKAKKLFLLLAITATERDVFDTVINQNLSLADTIEFITTRYKFGEDFFKPDAEAFSPYQRLAYLKANLSSPDSIFTLAGEFYPPEDPAHKGIIQALLNSIGD